jgi:protein TonB
MSRLAMVVGAARWLVALGIVTSAHAAAISLMLREPEPLPPEETSGAFVVELAQIVAAAPAPLFELPPGPPSIDSVEAPQIAASAKAEPPPPEPELPPLPTLPSAPPEIALPRPVERPSEQVPPEKKVEQQQQAAAPQAASIASRAAAPPPIEDAKEAAKPAAPSAGVSERDRRTRAQWQGALSAHLVRHARFPAAVRDHARDRQVLVRFRLDRRGNVISAAVAESSGSDPLDAEAEAMIRRASPMPVPPEQVTSEALDLVVPVRFKARR